MRRELTKTALFDILEDSINFEVIFLRIILLITGLALSLDGLYCGYTGSMGAGEWMVVAFGIMFILWSSFYDAFRSKTFLRILKGLFMTIVSICVIYSCFSCVLGRFDSDRGNEEYVVVLGSPLKDNAPTETLKNRLDTAVNYLNGHPGVTAIVSGSRSGRSAISEARAMHSYLIANGIEEDRIMLDESALNTHTTFVNAKAAVRDANTAFITSEFHVLRSLQMAELCEINGAAHIGAPTPWEQLPVCCAREILAEISTLRYYVN